MTSLNSTMFFMSIYTIDPFTTEGKKIGKNGGEETRRKIQTPTYALKVV